MPMLKLEARLQYILVLSSSLVLSMMVGIIFNDLPISWAPRDRSSSIIGQNDRYSLPRTFLNALVGLIADPDKLSMWYHIRMHCLPPIVILIYYAAIASELLTMLLLELFTTLEGYPTLT
jgi:hypothetical protein